MEISVSERPNQFGADFSSNETTKIVYASDHKMRKIPQDDESMYISSNSSNKYVD